jgi:hypothetical protein
LRPPGCAFPTHLPSPPPPLPRCAPTPSPAHTCVARLSPVACPADVLQQVIAHPTLKAITDPLLELRTVLRGKALMRLKYEGKDKAPELSNPDSRWYNDPEGYAEDLFAYYMCFKCKKPYYGGERVCGEAGGAFDPTELVCGGCSPWSGDIDCPKHGKDFIEFKCRFCCSVAVRGVVTVCVLGEVACVWVGGGGNRRGRCCALQLWWGLAHTLFL